LAERAPEFQIALVSREVFPFGGGGLGSAVAATAEALGPIADVTILTTDLHEGRYRELSAAGSHELPEGVTFEFVPEAACELGTYDVPNHCWSARVLGALRSLYPDGGPDIVEFPDYNGEACVTVQAKRSLDPSLRNTLVCVRLYTSVEMCAVLNGYRPDDIYAQSVFELERHALRFADRIIWPGGDVMGAYRRFYGDSALAEPVRIRHAVTSERSEDDTDAYAGPDSVRFLYLGRLERRKGVQNLLRAVTGLDRDDWSVTLVGGDTETAPLGYSMGEQLRLMAADDPRITFVSDTPRRELPRLIREHDVTVLPSLWECWPFVALHSFDQNRPVLATPTGGFVELVSEESGWLTKDTSAVSLESRMRDLIDRPQELDEIRRHGGPRFRFDRLTDPEQIRSDYADLACTKRAVARAGARENAPLVSAIVPYFQMERFIEDAVSSLFEQTHRDLEVFVVNDGSFRERDWILGKLATRYPITVVTQPNSGLGAARNFGISQSRGRYVLPLDADNMLEPTFIERAVEILEQEPEAAYVTSWLLYIEEDGAPYQTDDSGFHPIGNAGPMVDHVNIAGDGTSVYRKSIFDRGFSFSVDLTSYEDWFLYRQLRRAGLYGRVIPERLIRYRVRSDSMLREVGQRHEERLRGEMRAHMAEAEMQWTVSAR
jgi:glycosyltransferase involved in cell wall biosynthesis